MVTLSATTCDFSGAPKPSFRSSAQKPLTTLRPIGARREAKDCWAARLGHAVPGQLPQCSCLPRFLPRWPAASRVMCLADPTRETFSFFFALSFSLSLHELRETERDK